MLAHPTRSDKGHPSQSTIGLMGWLLVERASRTDAAAQRSWTVVPPKYASRCVERFLEYVTIDTQSSEDSESYPSTPGQLDLLRLLVDELSELGI
jgi:hypothetical protein